MSENVRFWTEPQDDKEETTTKTKDWLFVGSGFGTALLGGIFFLANEEASLAVRQQIDSWVLPSGAVRAVDQGPYRRPIYVVPQEESAAAGESLQLITASETAEEANQEAGDSKVREVVLSNTP